MTARVWGELENPPAERSAGPRPPSSQRWFSSGLVLGSPYDFCSRNCDLHALNNLDAKSLAALAEIAPYNWHVLYAAADARGDRSSPALALAFKAIADFHLDAATEIAKPLKSDPKAYAAAMMRVAEIDADEYVPLALYLVSNGLIEEAAKAFQAAVEKAPDRVRVANNSDWLINYYMDNNRKAEAIKLAEEAAEVYSFRGLEAAGHLMERLEDWPKAYEYFAAINERYDDERPLYDYLKKYKDTQPAVAKEYAALTAKAFPDGMKKVTLADFKDPPADGAVFTTNSERMIPYEIRVGHVVVGLDGYAVHSMAQYDFIRAMSSDAPLQLILWNGSEYREVTASVPNRRFDCGMTTYLK